ncbi:MAG: hypothetical protein IT163_09825 [Bryobacterales bacterium]|nr:hypothetical protein [Bryobacterales bacterium]
MCLKCYTWHVVAIAQVRGITGCCECHSTFRQLRERTGRSGLRLVPKDGIYQLMCEPCYGPWLLLNREQVKGTAFAKARKLY